jgi:Mu-like prophage I protein
VPDSPPSTGAPPTVLRGVELARPGTYQLSSGQAEFTEEMLADAADYYHATGRGAIPVGLGHLDQRFDGEPSFGWIENVRLVTDTRGPVLVGDLVDMPAWLAAEAPKRWRNRSIEGFKDVVHAGRTYGLALTRLALLGATPPGIPSISSLHDLQSALAASVRIVASVADPEPQPADPPVQPPPRVPVPPVPPGPDPTTDPEPSGPANDVEGAGMDPAKLREALGLQPGDSDEKVKEALAKAGLTTDPPQPAPQPDPGQPQPGQPQPDPGQPADPPTGPRPVDVSQSHSLAAAAAAAGAVVLDKGIWTELQDRVKVGEQAAAKLHTQERDQIIASAVNEGRIPPSNRDYWARLWDADPKGTTEVIAKLQKNLIPVAATGYMGAMDDDGPDPYAGLFPPTADQSKGR